MRIVFIILLIIIAVIFVFFFLSRIFRLKKACDIAKNTIQTFWTDNGAYSQSEKDVLAYRLFKFQFEQITNRSQFRLTYQVLLAILPEVIANSELRSKLADEFIAAGLCNHFISESEAERIFRRLCS